MTVYVDGESNPLGRMKMCHMWADTPEELHAMADAIGMRRSWYQTPDGPPGCRASFPHYDVAKGRRAKAVRLGAVEVTRREGVTIRAEIRARIIADMVFAQTWRWEAGQQIPPPRILV